MEKEWYTAKELAGIPGLPKSRQGVNLKARSNKWLSRKRTGVQGKAVEYHIDSLPENIQFLLKSYENQSQYNHTYSNSYSPTVMQADPFVVWISVYNQLTAKEREQLIALIIHVGVDNLLKLMEQIDDKNE